MTVIIAIVIVCLGIIIPVCLAIRDINKDPEKYLSGERDDEA